MPAVVSEAQQALSAACAAPRPSFDLSGRLRPSADRSRKLFMRNIRRNISRVGLPAAQRAADCGLVGVHALGKLAIQRSMAPIFLVDL